MPKRPPHERHVPSSAIAGFIDPVQIEAVLAPWIPDRNDRAFVARCVVGEGPAHHRGANFVILRLLGQVLEQLPSSATASSEAGAVEVPVRLPPHLAREAGPTPYPLRLPLAPLTGLVPAGSREQEAMVDCLTDGPPQHALANVAMVTLLGEILARLKNAPR